MQNVNGNGMDFNNMNSNIENGAAELSNVRPADDLTDEAVKIAEQTGASGTAENTNKSAESGASQDGSAQNRSAQDGSADGQSSAKSEGSSDAGKEIAQEKTDVPSEEEQIKKIRRISKAERQIRGVQRFGLHAVLFVIVIWVLFTWIIGLATVPNGDMYPRLDAGDLLIYYRLDKDVRDQDVIVFKKNDTRYVGRVVAIGGDTVEITDGNFLKVNGNSVIESNIFYATPRYEGYVNYPLTLDKGTCFVLCDHRQGGEDSRYFGPVSEKEILGTVITVVRRNKL